MYLERVSNFSLLPRYRTSGFAVIILVICIIIQSVIKDNNTRTTEKVLKYSKKITVLWPWPARPTIFRSDTTADPLLALRVPSPLPLVVGKLGQGSLVMYFRHQA